MLEQQKQHQDQQAQQQQPQSLANTAQPLPTAATSSITGELPPPAGAASGQLALEVPMAADPSNQLVPIVPPVPLMNSLVSTNKVVMNHSLLNPMPSGAIAPTQLVSAPLVAEIRPSPAGDGSLSPAVTAVQPQLVPASAAPVDADDGEAGGNAAEQCQDEDSPMTGTLPPSTPIEHGNKMARFFF